jgi:hypothetical protein
MSLLSRGDQVSSTRPDPPPCAHRREFSTPAIDTAEIADQRIAQLAFRLALGAQRCEKELV